ncbi:MAG: hypothetical protein AAB250_06240, partial [Bdellovibrionota bacterium]
MGVGTKIAALRRDLKISRQVQSEKVNYVVKDPIKGEYYRFDESEWRIISIFDGPKTPAEALADYNATHPLDPIDLDVLKDFEKSLEGMHLLEKTARDMNVMLVEKMKETRKSMLLSKQGSLMYKRFPLVDPDKFFDRVVPRIWFFWTKGFLVFSFLTMLVAMIMVGYRFDEFSNSVFEIFSFSQMSWWNLAFLWVTIYSIIAIHELGHGFTCKRYGGEVHEIGFLLLFFQPCLYANVNDAWLFDKKWKQVLVTIAGGYIEFFVGALFAILWALTNPGTMINVLSLQVMTICSVSTVLFNFNPLMKLDGYYLLADALEIPNLRDSSFAHLKWLAKTKLLRMDDPEGGDCTSREAIIFTAYGVSAFFWVAGSTLGLFYLAKGFLIDQLQGLGVVISLWIAYKLFGGHVKKVKATLLELLISHREFLMSRRGKWMAGSVVAALLAVLFLPVPYRVLGKCALSPTSFEIVRASASGVLRKYSVTDGSSVANDVELFEIENPSLTTDLEITRIGLDKLEVEARAASENNVGRLASLMMELEAKRSTAAKLLAQLDGLKGKARTRGPASIASCPDQTRRLNTFVKEGDEICRLFDVAELKATVEVPEQDVRFIALGSEVQ